MILYPLTRREDRAVRWLTPIGAIVGVAIVLFLIAFSVVAAA